MSTQKITDDMTDEQKEHIRAKRREWQRNYRERNKEKIREQKKKYYQEHPEKYAEKQRKNAARRRAKNRLAKLDKMYKGEPAKPKPRPKKYHEFDRDKLAAYKMTKEERQKVKEWKTRLEELDRQYDSKAIDLEYYINQRSNLLNKIKKYDKTYTSNDDE